MERDFHSGGFSQYQYQYQSFPFTTGGGGDGDTCQDDSSSIDAMFSGVSLLSLLTSSNSNSNSNSNPDFDFFSLIPPLPQPHQHLPIPLSSSSFIPDSASATFGFFPDPYPYPYPEPDAQASKTLKLPKLEPSSLSLALDDSPTPTHFSLSQQQQPFNFMPTDSLLFHSLPDLISLDPLTHSSPSPSSSSSASLPPFHKRRRLDSESCRQNQYHPPLPLSSPPNPFLPEDDEEAAASSSSSPPVMVPRSSALARQRRQKLSDKTRHLQKLLPWDKKMNIATMLEEAYNYVKFLQAQLTALHSMPSHSSIPDPVHGDHLTSVFGVLGRLNRNQLLQVLVNSPVTQTLLCSHGCCVFSVEQLDMLKMNISTTKTMGTNSLHPNLSDPLVKLA